MALNGSGRAPAAASVEWFAERQMAQIETQTAHAVTIPGAVDAWCLLNRKYGKKPLAELLEPAGELRLDFVSGLPTEEGLRGLARTSLHDLR